jgi:hypothetical protein
METNESDQFVRFFEAWDINLGGLFIFYYI